MAVASIRTLLPLDRWAALLGIAPTHFNGVTVETSIPYRRGCGSVIPQFNWQAGDRVGREDIAYAIQQAEDTIRDILGYSVLPKYEIDERFTVIQPSDPTLYAAYLRDVRWFATQKRLRYGHFIGGGQEVKTPVVSGTTITYSDEDNDGYDETATVTFATSVTDTNDLGIFYPGEAGDDAWEIRPLTSIAISSGTATVTFRREQCVLPELLSTLDYREVDGSVDANFLTTVDAYERSRDPQSQLQLMWGGGPSCGCDTGCATCAESGQAGCMVGTDYRLGMVTLGQATWDADTEAFTSAELASWRRADRARAWYQAGYRDKRRRRPMVEMDPLLEACVVMLSTGYLDRPICSCDAVRQFIQKWGEELTGETKSEGTAQRFQMSSKMLDNPLGTTRGALEVWRRLVQGDWMLGRAASA